MLQKPPRPVSLASNSTHSLYPTCVVEITRGVGDSHENIIQTKLDKNLRTLSLRDLSLGDSSIVSSSRGSLTHLSENDLAQTDRNVTELTFNNSELRLVESPPPGSDSGFSGCPGSVCSTSSSSPAPPISKRSNSVRFAEEKVTVLEEEEVTLLGPEETTNCYTKSPRVKHEAVVNSPDRGEYIPPRAFARRPDMEENTLEQGCFYFVACLDTLEIL